MSRGRSRLSQIGDNGRRGSATPTGIEKQENLVKLQSTLIFIHQQMEEYENVVNNLEENYNKLASREMLNHNLKIAESSSIMGISYALKNIVNDPKAYPNRAKIIDEVERIIEMCTFRPVIKFAKAFNETLPDYDSVADHLYSPKGKKQNKKLHDTEEYGGHQSNKRVNHTMVDTMRTSQHTLGFDELPNALNDLLKLNLVEEDRSSCSDVLHSHHDITDSKLYSNRLTAFKSQKECPLNNDDSLSDHANKRSKLKARSNTIHKISSNRDVAEPPHIPGMNLLANSPIASPCLSPVKMGNPNTSESLPFDSLEQMNLREVLNSKKMSQYRDFALRKKKIITNNFFQVMPVQGDIDNPRMPSKPSLSNVPSPHQFKSSNVVQPRKKPTLPGFQKDAARFQEDSDVMSLEQKITFMKPDSRNDVAKASNSGHNQTNKEPHTLKFFKDVDLANVEVKQVSRNLEAGDMFGRQDEGHIISPLESQIKGVHLPGLGFPRVQRPIIPPQPKLNSESSGQTGPNPEPMFQTEPTPVYRAESDDYPTFESPMNSSQRAFKNQPTQMTVMKKNIGNSRGRVSREDAQQSEEPVTSKNKSRTKSGQKSGMTRIEMSVTNNEQTKDKGRGLKSSSRSRKMLGFTVKVYQHEFGDDNVSRK